MSLYERCRERSERYDSFRREREAQKDAQREKNNQRYRAQMTMMYSKDENAKAIARNIWSQNM